MGSRATFRTGECQLAGRMGRRGPRSAAKPGDRRDLHPRTHVRDDCGVRRGNLQLPRERERRRDHEATPS